MQHGEAVANMKFRRAALAIAAIAVSAWSGPAAHAQSIMRTPNLNLGSRIPTISPGVAARSATISNVGRATTNNIGRATTNVGRTATAVRTPSGPRLDTRLDPRLATRPHQPFPRYSPNLYPACGAAYGGDDGPCLSGVETTVAVRGNGGGPVGRDGKRSSRSNPAQTAAALAGPTIPNELLAEIDGGLNDAQADELARRHGLRRIETQAVPLLIDARIALFRITDRRPFETVRGELAAETGVRSVQANFRYWLQDQKPAAKADDLPQYVLSKLRLPEAHKLAKGADVTVAVIDSGIDAGHPELAGSVADSFDALGNGEGPHVHGTGIAGAVVAHARLEGSAPAARLLAIRAFGATAKGAQSSSLVILKGMNYAAEHGARIVNMSFAGPKDALIERGVMALAARGIVMVAAAGNAGAKSPPLYPAAYPAVIAVSATDAEDRLLPASNRGGYVAVAAPGADVLLPAPGQKYQITSGTSFSAAYVSGIAALLLGRSQALKPDEVRATLMRTARDLGSPGRDDLFGAGEADAYAAVEAAASPSAPVAAADPPGEASKQPEKRVENVAEPKENSTDRAPAPPVATMASDKPAAGGADH
jgi:subtilisin family serine protease